MSLYGSFLLVDDCHIRILVLLRTRHVLLLQFFYILLHPPPRSTLFPYTTLFRSGVGSSARHHRVQVSQSGRRRPDWLTDRKSTRLNSSHTVISYAVFCLKKKRDTVRSVSSRWSNRSGRVGGDGSLTRCLAGPRR